MLKFADVAGDEWDDLLIFIDATTVNVDDLVDIYHADIELTRDSGNTRDEYTVTWLKSGVRITSGITSPTIQVINRADGTDLISAAEGVMDEVEGTGSYWYNDSTNRITAGEAVIAIATATIDGTSRTFPRVLTRDS